MSSDYLELLLLITY